MNFTKATNVKPNEAPKKPFKLWKVPFRLMGWVLLLVLLVLFAAPTILSTSFAREKVLEIANKFLGKGSIEIEDWSLAWFGEQSLSGIKFVDPTLGVDLDVKNIRASSLWELLPLGQMKANMTIDSPFLLLSEPQEEVIDKTIDVVTRIEEEGSVEVVLPTESTSVAPEQVATTPKKKKVTLPDLNLSLRFIILNAGIQAEDLAEPLVQKGDFEIVMEAMDKDISTKIHAQVLDATLDANATIAPVEQLIVARTPAAFLRTASFTIDAPWAKVGATATSYRGLAYPETTLDAALYLPQLVTRLRALRIPLEGLVVNSGNIAVNLDVKRSQTPHALLINSKIETTDIDYVYQGTSSKPAGTIALNAHVVYDNLLASELINFTTKLPGITAEGSGTIKQGKFTADIEAQTLLDTLRPFASVPTLAQPLKTRIEAVATPESATIDLACTSNQATVATAKLVAKEIDVAKQYIKEMTLASSADIATVMAFAPAIENIQDLKGKVYCNASASGSPLHLKSKVLFGMNSATIQMPGWKVQETQLMKGSCTIDYTKTNGVDVQNLKIETPFMNLNGKATYKLGIPTSQAVTAEITGTANPAYPMTKWKVAKEGEQPFPVSGTLALQLVAHPTTTSVLFPNVDLTVSSEKMTVALPNKPAIETPLTLKTSVSANEAQDIHLSSLSLDTLFVDLTETKGAYTKAGEASLDGVLALDLTTLWKTAFFNELRAKGIMLEGISKEPFSFRAPVTMGAAGILNKGEATAGVTFDYLKVPTTEIPNGRATVSLKEGIAALDFTTEINDGVLLFQPRVNLAQQPYSVTLPENAHILQNMTVTQLMLDEGLKFVSPLLPGSASPTGKINLKVPHFTMVLNDDPVMSIDTKVDIQTDNVTFTANDMMNTLVTMLKLDPTLRVTDQDIHVTVSEGKVVTENIALRLQDTHLTCHGTTDLKTQAIDFKLALPLTRALIGGSVAQRLDEGETLVLPIQGTISKPQLDLESIKSSLLSTARNTAAERLAEKLGDDEGEATRDSLEALQQILEGEAGQGGENDPLSMDGLSNLADSAFTLFSKHKEKKEAKKKAAEEEAAPAEEPEVDEKKEKKEKAKDALESALKGLFG